MGAPGIEQGPTEQQCQRRVLEDVSELTGHHEGGWSAHLAQGALRGQVKDGEHPQDRRPPKNRRFAERKRGVISVGVFGTAHFMDDRR